MNTTNTTSNDNTAVERPNYESGTLTRLYEARLAKNKKNKRIISPENEANARKLLELTEEILTQQSKGVDVKPQFQFVPGPDGKITVRVLPSRPIGYPR